MHPEPEVFHSSGGARIYRFPLDLFPDLSGYAHLVYHGDLVALIDVGSGFGASNEQLEAGLQAVREGFGERAAWGDLTHVLITHGHLDHFGGLAFVRSQTDALVGVHELDLRVLANYEERLMVVARRLRAFLVEAGVDDSGVRSVMDLYLVNKVLGSSVEVDFTYEAAGMAVGPLRMIHVPGHCPGHVVIQVDDVLLSGDHVLAHTSPHQAPESLTLNMGLGHYIASLGRLKPLAERIRLTLGGHEKPIADLAGRMDEILALHHERLEQVLELAEKPQTIAQISAQLFPDPTGYHVLLALEETGAHVEFLVQRGYLEVENLQDLEDEGLVAIRYRRREGFAPPLNLPSLAMAESGLAVGSLVSDKPE